MTSSTNPILRWVKETWYGSDPVEFVSAYGLQESVARLKAATKRWAFSALWRESAVGTVEAENVSLYRVIPMVQNSFKPYFRGRFIEKSDKVVLVGRFTMFLPVKIFMSMWLTFVLLFTVVSPFAGQPQKGPPLPMFGFLMFSFGIALIWSGRWTARNDSRWLSEVIRHALAAAAPGTAPPLSPQQKSNLPRNAALLFVVVAVANAVQAITGIQAWHANGQNTYIAYFNSEALRYVTLAFGLYSLVLAYGLYRRMQLAWRGVLLVIALSWPLTMVNLLSAQQAPPKVAIGAMFIGGLFVVFTWGRWWWGQREHFIL